MPNQATLTRRSFLKTLGNGMVVGLTVSSLPSQSTAQASSSSPDAGTYTPPSWAPVPGQALHRIDGVAKVKAEKLFARDFRVRDFPAWPQVERMVHALRADRIDRIVLGYDLSMLPDTLQPMVVVDQSSLDANRMQTAGGMEQDKPFFIRINEAPHYYGQPLAMLIFADFSQYRRAVKILDANPQCIKWGEAVPDRELANYLPESHFVRDDDTGFSFVGLDPAAYESGHAAVTANISARIEQNTRTGSWRSYHRDFITQATDPVFMEPESGMAWYDPARQKLHLLLGTQSPGGDIENAAEIFAARDQDGQPACRFPLSATDGIELISCYPGGGFGGRDTSCFGMYLAMVAPFADGPVRWAFTRPEQFQVGLKRHQTVFSETLACNENGELQALECSIKMNGGGRQNLSPYVAQLAALSSCGAYEIPAATAHAFSSQTRDLIGGSQRGFGSPQASIAIEALLDEAAADLNIDPFTLRRRNLLTARGRSISGAPVLQDLQLAQMLDRLETHALWQDRFARQAEASSRGLRYGVGLALANKAYGTGSDGMYAGIDILEDGSIRVRTPYIDMGNGAATSLGLAPARYLGRNANHIVMGDAAYFSALNLSTAADPANASYILEGSGSASASMGAFHQHHVVTQAGLTLLLAAVMPAVNRLWGSNLSHEQIQWHDGWCHSPGLTALNWPEIVATIIDLQLPQSTAVHASYRAQFVLADFMLANATQQFPLDYIAMGSLDGALRTVPRSRLLLPPAITGRYGRSTFAPCAALVAVSLNQETAAVKVEACISVLSAGVQHCPELVSGQSEGAVAMGIGYTLMETCPLDAAGPGNGRWNLHDYQLPTLADMPAQLELIVLPPAPDETTARGIAEAVMCPIPPAILNALAMATGGVRFSKLPVTPDMIRELLP